MFGGNIFIGNRGGIPIVTATPTVGTADVQISLPNNVFRFLGTKGFVVLSIPAPVPTGTTGTLPVLVEVNGQTRPLVSTTETALTAADVIGMTAMLILFDKSENKLQVLSNLI